MKYQLIINNNAAFITSDEELNKNDKPCKCYNSIKNTWNDDIVLFQGVMPMYHYKGFKKIIAGIEGLPSIDWNGLEEEFGRVDVEKLANQVYQPEPSSISEYAKDLARPKRKAFIKGFKKAQSLNEKKFSLEDIEKSIEMTRIGFKDYPNNSFEAINNYIKSEKNRIIQSLQQPKVFDIEIDTEWNGGRAGDSRDEPKITNNSIKILKKL